MKIESIDGIIVAIVTFHGTRYKRIYRVSVELKESDIKWYEEVLPDQYITLSQTGMYNVLESKFKGIPGEIPSRTLNSA